MNPNTSDASSTGSSRFRTLLVFALACLVWLAAMAELLSVPSAMRDFTFVDARTGRAIERVYGLAPVRCVADASVSARGSVWRVCSGEGEWVRALVRFDPESGRALAYRIEDESELVGAALGARGDLALAIYAHGRGNVYLVSAGAAPRKIASWPVEHPVRFPLREQARFVAGLAFRGDTLELVYRSPAEVRGYRNGVWTSRPLESPEGFVSPVSVAAYLEQGHWRVLWVDANRSVDRPAIERDERGLDTRTFDISSPPGAAVLDGSPGGVPRSAVTVERVGRTWQAIAVPRAVGRERSGVIAGDIDLDTPEPSSVLSVRERAYRVRGSWILSDTDRNALRTADHRHEAVINATDHFVSTRVLPYGRDGYLLITGAGAHYARFDRGLERTDALTVFERLSRFFSVGILEYGLLTSQSLIARLSVPWFVLGFPLAVLLSLLARARGANDVWLRVYLIGCLVLAFYFVRVTTQYFP